MNERMEKQINKRNGEKNKQWTKTRTKEERSTM